MTSDEFLSRVPLIKTETKRLSAVWRAFSEQDWKTRTYCPGWAAEDVVPHITTGAEFYAHSARRSLDGLPPEPPYGKDAKEFWAMRKEKSEAIKALPRDEMMNLFEKTAAELQSELERIEVKDFDTLTYHPRGLTPLDAWIGMRLVELVVHEWDINYGRDSSIRVVPQGVVGMIIFIPAFAARLFNRRESPSYDARYYFRSTDPDREWTIEVASGQAESSPEVAGNYDAEFTADGEAHLLLPYGRMDWSDAEASGRLGVEGNREVAEKFLNLVYTTY